MKKTLIFVTILLFLFCFYCFEDEYDFVSSDRIVNENNNSSLGDSNELNNTENEMNADPINNSIVGDWEVDNYFGDEYFGTHKFKFNSDGTGFFISGNDAGKYHFNYEVNGVEVTINYISEIPVETNPGTYDFEIQNNILILNNIEYTKSS